MKDKIKQSGFKSQKEFADSLDICHESICGWNKKPEKCPKVYFKYLDLMIKDKSTTELKNQIKELKKLLANYERYFNQ